MRTQIDKKICTCQIHRTKSKGSKTTAERTAAEKLWKKFEIITSREGHTRSAFRGSDSGKRKR